MCSHCGKKYGISAKKLKMVLPFDPDIPLLGIYPKNLETPKELMHPSVHSSAIYNSQVLEQPKCPSVNEWIKKLLHLHNGILCCRNKEEAPTLGNSIHGTGEYYAK